MEQLKVNLVLPTGDDREIKAVYTEQKADGTWNIHVTVSPDTATVKLANELVLLYSIFDEACSKVENLAKRNNECTK